MDLLRPESSLGLLIFCLPARLGLRCRSAAAERSRPWWVWLLPMAWDGLLLLRNTLAPAKIVGGPFSDSLAVDDLIGTTFEGPGP